MCYFLFFFEGSGAPRDLHVLTHSFPTRRSSDLSRRARSCCASTLALSLRTSEAMSVTRPGRRSLPPLLTALTRNSEPHAAKTSGVPTRQRPRLLPPTGLSPFAPRGRWSRGEVGMAPTPTRVRDRKSGGWGQRVSVRVGL